MREHVHWPYCCDLIVAAEDFQVSCLRGRVAADIDHALRCCIEDDLSDIRMDSCSRRVKDDYVRTSMLLHESIGEDILHIACVEVAVGDSVVGGVDLCILDGFGHIFNAYYPGRLS